MMGLASLLKEEVQLGFGGRKETMPPEPSSLAAAPTGGNKKSTTVVTWQTFNPNYTRTERDNGEGIEFRRGTYGSHDAALGQSFTSGTHSWVVTAPNWTPNQYVGVADAGCDLNIYPAATAA